MINQMRARDGRIAALLAFMAALTVPLYAAFAIDRNTMLLPVVHVTDGDSIVTNLDRYHLPLGLSRVSVRMAGIDTPERGSRARCQAEHEAAVRARNFVAEIVGPAGDRPVMMQVTNPVYDKYGGRIVGRVFINGRDVAAELVLAGLAYEYNGGTKRNIWC